MTTKRKIELELSDHEAERLAYLVSQFDGAGSQSARPDLPFKDQVKHAYDYIGARTEFARFMRQLLKKDFA